MIDREFHEAYFFLFALAEVVFMKETVHQVVMVLLQIFIFISCSSIMVVGDHLSFEGFLGRPVSSLFE